MKNWLFYIFNSRALAEALTFFMGGGGTSTVTEKSYTPEEEAMRKQLLSDAQAVYAKTQPGYESALYPGAKPVGPSAATTQSQQLAAQVATGQGQDVANQAAGALKFGLQDVLNPASNPGFQGYLDSAVRKVGETYTDPGGVISNIRSNFMQTSPTGQSSREAIAMGQAGKNYLNTVGDVTAGLTSQAYGQGLNTFNSALAFSPQAYNLMMQPSAALSAVGGQQEAYQAQQEAYDAASRQWGLSAPWQGLQNFSNMVNGNLNPSSQSSSNTASNPAMAAAGGALAGWAVGAQIGSAYGPYGAIAGAAIGLLSS